MSFEDALLSYQPRSVNARDCWVLLRYVRYETDLRRVLAFLDAPEEGTVTEMQFHEEGFLTLDGPAVTVEFLGDSAQCPLSDLRAEVATFLMSYDNDT